MNDPQVKEPTEKEQAEAQALAHILDEPTELTLSTGDTVRIYAVTPRAMFRIAAQREALRWALEQYEGFRKSAADPGARLWAQGRRLPYWYKKWLDALEQTCWMMLTASVSPRMKGLFRRVRIWWAGRRTRRILRRASFQDWCEIVEAYNRMHDIDRLLVAVFGPAKAQEKKTNPS